MYNFKGRKVLAFIEEENKVWYQFLCNRRQDLFCEKQNFSVYLKKKKSKA